MSVRLKGRCPNRMSIREYKRENQRMSSSIHVSFEQRAGAADTTDNKQSEREERAQERTTLSLRREEQPKAEREIDGRRKLKKAGGMGLAPARIVEFIITTSTRDSECT